MLCRYRQDITDMLTYRCWECMAEYESEEEYPYCPYCGSEYASDLDQLLYGDGE